MNWQTGNQVGPYLILDVFNAGGMGQVFRARHLGWGVDVAIKVVKPEKANEGHYIASLLVEAEHWAELGLHPHVTTCYFTQILNGMPCIVAEFVEQGSLGDLIRSRALYQGGESAALSRIIEISAQAALGLSWAHGKGLVHQDVKPGNFLIASDGSAKVSDFGLASSINRHGLADVLGRTEAYASPEQLTGQQLTPMTDVWSWALSVLEMFFGGLKWPSGLAARALFDEYRAHHSRLPGLPQMPESLADLLEACFQMHPEARPSFNDLAAGLAEIHEELFDESLEFPDTDLPTLQTDSLNNRAVSFYETGRTQPAMQKLTEVLSADPRHLEGVFNSGLLRHLISGTDLSETLAKLRDLAVPPAHKWRRARLLAAAYLAQSDSSRARRCLEGFSPNDMSTGESQQLAEISAWIKVGYRPQHLMLAPPRPASELAAEAARFHRLLPKAERAVSEGKREDAARYLLMLGDLPDYASHPDLVRLRRRFG